MLETLVLAPALREAWCRDSWPRSCAPNEEDTKPGQRPPLTHPRSCARRFDGRRPVEHCEDSPGDVRPVACPPKQDGDRVGRIAVGALPPPPANRDFPSAATIEVGTVVLISELYLELGSLLAVAQEMRIRGRTRKTWTTREGRLSSDFPAVVRRFRCLEWWRKTWTAREGKLKERAPPSGLGVRRSRRRRRSAWRCMRSSCQGRIRARATSSRPGQVLLGRDGRRAPPRQPHAPSDVHACRPRLPPGTQRLPLDQRGSVQPLRGGLAIVLCRLGGMGRPSSLEISIHSRITISTAFKAASYVGPSAMHPGSSGTSAIKD